MSISDIRKQLADLKQSMASFTEVIESIYARVDMLESSTEPIVEMSTRDAIDSKSNGDGNHDGDGNSTPLRGYTTGVSTPTYGFAQPINPRRLTSTGGINDSLHTTLPINPPVAPTAEGTRSLPTVPPLSNIENVIKRYGKDLISNINVLWYFSNMHTSNPERPPTLTVTPSENFLLGKLDALKPYRISKLDILHVATRIVKIMDLLSQTRAIDAVPTVGFVDPGIRSIVVSKFLAVNSLPPLAERMVLLQFENATELVLTQPNEYGIGALITGVIKCIAGMRNNSVFVDVLRKLSMFLPAVHEGKLYSLDMAHQSLQSYHKLFSTVVEMSKMLYPTAVENYPRLYLVTIYLEGLKSKGVSANPFSKVVTTLGTSEYSTYTQVYNVLLDMFTSSASMELVGDPKTYLTWGGSSQRRMSAKAEYIKGQPTLHAMITSSGYSAYYDAYEVPEYEVDEFVYSLSSNYTDDEVSSIPDEPTDDAAMEEGYLRARFAENEEMEQLYALSAMDTPCWVHFGHALFQDPKSCSRRECRHSHNHEDPTLAELYRTRQRETHLKMMRTSRTPKGRSSGPPAATKSHHHARGKA